MRYSKPLATPTEDVSLTPPCFGLKSLENKCIKCIWVERCLYDSYMKEIENFKHNSPELYTETKDKFLNSNLLDSLD